MITIDLGALYEAQPVLARLATLDLPIKTAYHVMKLIKLTSDDAKHFALERTRLITEYGKERPLTDAERVQGLQPPIIEIDPTDAERFAPFLAKYTELGKLSVTIDWTPLTLDELGTITISARELASLDELLAKE